MLVHLYNSSTDLILAYDASLYCVGVVLSHRYSDSEEKLSCFAVTFLGRGQKKYSQLEREGGYCL